MKTVTVYSAQVDQYDDLFMNTDLNDLMYEVNGIFQLNDEPYEDHLHRYDGEVSGGYLIMEGSEDSSDPGHTVTVRIRVNELEVS